MTELNHEFLEWIEKGRPPISEISKEFHEEIFGEPYDEENRRAPLEISDDELWETSGHNAKTYANFLEQKSEAETAKKIEDGEFDQEDLEEQYERFVEKYGRDWQNETDQYLKKSDDDRSEYAAEVEEY